MSLPSQTHARITYETRLAKLEKEHFGKTCPKGLDYYAEKYPEYKFLLKGENVSPYHFQNLCISLGSFIRHDYTYPSRNTSAYNNESSFRNPHQLWLPVDSEFKQAMQKRNTNYHFPKDIIKEYKFEKISGKQVTVAVVDRWHNLFFIPFTNVAEDPKFQTDKLFEPVFEFILEDYMGNHYHRINIQEIIDKIGNVSASFVKTVEITTEFDKEKYLIDTQELMKSTLEGIKATNEAQVKSLKRAMFEQRIHFNDETKRTLALGFTTGLKSLRDGWVLNNDSTSSDFGRICFSGKIYCQRMKYKKEWIYADKYKIDGINPYFIKDLSVQIRDTITASSIKISKDSNHPNVHNGAICIGTLNGMPLDYIMENLIDTLKTGNLDSPLDRTIHDKLLPLFDASATLASNSSAPFSPIAPSSPIAVKEEIWGTRVETMHSLG